MPLCFRHPAIESQVNSEFAVILLWVSQSVEHCGTQEFDPNRRASFIDYAAIPAHNRYGVKSFVNRFHAQLQFLVSVRTHQALASGPCLFFMSSKQKPNSGLSRAGFHALVGRIFATALNRNLHA